MTRPAIPSVAFLLCLCAASSATEVRRIDIWDQVVAKVNTEDICKRDVEERMGGIAEKLTVFKRDKIAAGAWTPEADVQWTQLYVDSFREALRKIVRERLMLQYYTREKMTIDEKALQKRQANYIKYMRDEGVTKIDVADVQKRVKEGMMLEEFRGKFDNQMEYPKKPEVEKYYRDHLDKYQRKAAVKVRMIRIDLSYIDKLTGEKVIRENAYETLKKIREEIVQGGSLFSEVAKVKNDDAELRERGGLLEGPYHDPYVILEEYNKMLIAPLASLETGKVSDLFPLGNIGYAIAVIEERREAGPAPLEGKLYEKIYTEMYDNKKTKKEDEWFRATLAKTLVMQIVEGNARPLPIEFFFPEEKKNPDFISSGNGTPAARPR